MKRKVTIIAILAILLTVTAFAAMSGNGSIPFARVMKLLFYSGDCAESFIIRELRLPRVILAMLCGGALGAAGAVLQSVLRNPLASPDLLGISAGGGCAGLCILLWFPALMPFAGVAVFCGALLVTLFICLAAWKKRYSPLQLILTGVALSALFGTFSSIMLIMASEKYSAIFDFLAGGFANASWMQIKYFAPGAVLCIIAAMMSAKKLDILALGGDTAVNLGINVVKMRMLALTVAALGAASVAGAAGMLGFAGLIAPHTVRLLGKSGTNSFIIPAGALAGALLVVLGDWLGQIAAPEIHSIPAGVFLSGCGALFFIFLLSASRGDEL
ncbi:MAG: iron ABC transporter permease [Lentisphaerae bacterium]|nr:iron ABC transporter permease [Lentisphaerota bacterium]